jgi:hypothetical protein
MNILLFPLPAEMMSLSLSLDPYAPPENSKPSPAASFENIPDAHGSLAAGCEREPELTSLASIIRRI